MTETDPASRAHRLGLRTRRMAGVVLFLSFVDVFALLPTVGPHVEALGGGPAAIGLAVGAYSASNLPANVVGGILVDRWGRRRVLLLGLGLGTLAVAAYVLATSVGAFVGTRILHGIAGGILIPAVFAAAGDRAEPGTAGRSFGRLGALIGAAAVVAPATAGIVRQTLSTEAVFLGIAGVLALALLVAWWGVHDRWEPPGKRARTASGQTDQTAQTDQTDADQRETHRAETSHAAIDRTEIDRTETDRTETDRRMDRIEIDRAEVLEHAMRALLSDPTLRRALAATATLTAAVGVLAGFLPGKAESLGAEPSAVGGLFTAYAVVAAAIMLSPLAGRVDRGRALATAAAGLAVLSIALILLAGAGALWAAVAASAVFGAGYGLIFPAVTGTTSLVASDATRGRAFGLFNMAFSLGLAVGPPVVGWAAEIAPRLDVFIPTSVLCASVAVWLMTTGGRERR